jgi:hypothetical protein
MGLVTHNIMNRFAPLSMIVIALSSCFAGTFQPIEAGKVNWGRDLDAALASSQQTGKPLFALFQEIPGCAGCQQFGRNVLSNPLLVEAIESELTPPTYS